MVVARFGIDAKAGGLPSNPVKTNIFMDDPKHLQKLTEDAVIQEVPNSKINELEE